MYWYWILCFSAPKSYDRIPRRKLVFTPFVSAGILFFILKFFSSFDVRGDLTYLSAYFVMGAAWTILGIHGFSILGVSARDHVIERKNDAASWLLSGATLAVTLCYAGGNIGDGPGWWVVVFASGLATMALYVVWLVLAKLGKASDSILLDRDTASGLRAGGFLLSSGLIFGRAAAGNWVSAEATIKDFLLLSWPVLLLITAALETERQLRPDVRTPQHPVFKHGAVPAIAYLVYAILVLWWNGAWK